MSINQSIFNIFGEHLEIISDSADSLSPLIERASTTVVQALLNDNKLLICGAGMSAALSQHFAAMLLNRFEHERPGLPAIALNADSATLTAISTDCGVNEVFSRQISALGQSGDILLIFSTTDNAVNLIQAIQVAHDHEINVIVMNGGDGGDISSLSKILEIVVDTRIHGIAFAMDDCGVGQCKRDQAEPEIV